MEQKSKPIHPNWRCGAACDYPWGDGWLEDSQRPAGVCFVHGPWYGTGCARGGEGDKGCYGGRNPDYMRLAIRLFGSAGPDFKIGAFRPGEPTQQMIEDAGPPSDFVQRKLGEMIDPKVSGFAQQCPYSEYGVGGGRCIRNEGHDGAHFVQRREFTGVCSQEATCDHLSSDEATGCADDGSELSRALGQILPERLDKILKDELPVHFYRTGFTFPCGAPSLNTSRSSSTLAMVTCQRCRDAAKVEPEGPQAVHLFRAGPTFPCGASTSLRSKVAFNLEDVTCQACRQADKILKATEERLREGASSPFPRQNWECGRDNTHVPDLLKEIPYPPLWHLQDGMTCCPQCGSLVATPGPLYTIPVGWLSLHLEHMVIQQRGNKQIFLHVSEDMKLTELTPEEATPLPASFSFDPENRAEAAEIEERVNRMQIRVRDLPPGSFDRHDFDAARYAAGVEKGAALERLDTSSLPVYIFENVSLDKFAAKYESMMAGLADELVSILARHAEDIYNQGLKDARRPGLYPYGVDDNPAWGNL